MTASTAFAEVWGVLLLTLAVMAALVFAAGKLRRQRRAKAAAALGLAAVPKPFTDEESAASSLLHLFNGGAQPGALRGMTRGGGTDTDTAIFDYDFILKSGFHASTETARQTAVALRNAHAGAEFLLTARRKRDWKQPPPGKTSFDFHPDFARRYTAETQQPDAVRRMLTAEKLLFLVKLAERETWTIWCADGWFILYRQGKIVSSGKLVAFLEDASRIVAVLQ